MTNRPMHNHHWTAEEDAKMISLYESGVSRAQIHQQMGCVSYTKFMIYGRLRRLGLNRGWGSSQPGVAQKNGKYVGRDAANNERKAKKQAIRTMAPASKADVPEPEPLSYGKVEPCSFVMSTKPTIYCDKPSVRGRSWCPEHHKICVVPWRRKDGSERLIRIDGVMVEV